MDKLLDSDEASLHQMLEDANIETAMIEETSLLALGNPLRCAIFERVAAAPASVEEIAAGLPVSRPAVSAHLKVLKTARLVADRPQGARKIYYADPTGLKFLCGWFVRTCEKVLAEWADI